MDDDQNTTHVIVRDFTLPARIGVYDHEHHAPQMVRISVDMKLVDYLVPHDRIEDTVSYEGVVRKIRELSLVHHDLAEKLAEHIADFCLSLDKIACVTVTVLKTEIFPEGAVGTTITRLR